MAILPIDFPRPRKNPQEVYDPQFLLGTVPVNGSVSTIFDLSGWTNFALKIDPNGGTILGGTLITVQAAATDQDTFQPYYGTSGATKNTIQCGSTGIQVLGPLTALAPLRYVRFVLGGTQDAARTLTVLAK